MGMFNYRVTASGEGNALGCPSGGAGLSRNGGLGAVRGLFGGLEGGVRGLGPGS